jgi:hypothetical protein
VSAAAEEVAEALHEYLEHILRCDPRREGSKYECSSCTVLFHRVKCAQSLWYLEKANPLNFTRSENQP